MSILKSKSEYLAESGVDQTVEPFLFQEYPFHPFLNQEIIIVQEKNIIQRLGSDLNN
jgi:hypothetical protein